MMMKIRKLCIFILAAMLCLCSVVCAENTQIPLSYALGDQIQDFSFTTYDGQTITLSETLKEKKAVLINIWATWCGPCRYEFPFMEEAYQQYQDDIEIFALSCERTDTDAVLADFAESMGLTFKIGQDPVGFMQALGVTGIPTTLMVDRFGTICFIQTGAQADAESFVRLFDAFVGDDYTESVLYEQLPPKKPDVPPSSEVELAQALNDAGGSIAFTNDASELIWPMIVGEKDGRTVVMSSNRGVLPSRAKIHANIQARKGDVLAVTFKLSSESGYDLMQLCINGEVVKSFGGEKEWMTYGYAFPADGEYAVTLAYEKDDMVSSGADMLWIDSVVLLSGDEAAAALENNPEYPYSEEVAISVENASAREIVFTDPTGMITANYGNGPFYLIPEDEAVFSFAITPEYDPETVVISFNFDGSTYALSECIVDGQYRATGGIDSVKTTGYCDSTVYLSTDADDIRSDKRITYFKDEANIEAFLKSLTTDPSGNVLGSWTYADSAANVKTENQAGKTEALEASYTFQCVDQNGDPVAGVMLQVCDEETCQVLVTDAQGICEFVGVPYTWEVHILKAPEGYTADTSEVLLTTAQGGEMVLTLTKN